MECPNCKTTIHGENYVFCPWCAEPVAVVDPILPDRVFADIPFIARLRIRGYRSFTLKQIRFRDTVLWSGLKLLRTNSDDSVILSIPRSAMFGSGELIFVFENGHTESRLIKIDDFKAVVFDIQSLQQISFDPSDSSNANEVFISIYHNDLTITVHGCDCEDLSIALFLGGETLDAQTEGNNFRWQLNDIKWILHNGDGWESSQYLAILRLRSSSIQNLELPLSVVFIRVQQIKVDQEYAGRQTKLVSGQSSRYDLKLEFTKNNVSEVGTDLYSYSIRSRSSCFIVRDQGELFLKDDRVNVSTEFVPPMNDSAAIEAGYIEFPFTVEVKLKNENGSILYIQEKVSIPFVSGTKTRGTVIIDFGTTNTCCVYDKNESTLLSDDEGNSELKTTMKFIRFDDNDLNQSIIEAFSLDIPPNSNSLEYVANFKSMLPNNIRLLYTDMNKQAKVIKASELVTLYLKQLKSKLLEQDINPESVIVTYPATFSATTRDLYLDQVRQLGWNVDASRCLTEPEAIALHNIATNKDLQSLAEVDRVILAVFDCGGGTTDFSLVEYFRQEEVDHVRVMATWGTDKFSGLYITYLVGKCFTKKYSKLPDSYSDIFSNSDNTKYFLSDCYLYLEQAKLKLSNNLEGVSTNDRQQLLMIIKDSIGAEDVEPKTLLSLIEDVNNESRPSITRFIDQIRSVTMQLYESDQIDKPEPDLLILAGNGSRFPFFRSIAEHEFPGRVLYDTDQLKTSVVQGARSYNRLDDEFLKVEGLQRSMESFYRTGAIGKYIQVFKPWLDMDGEHLYDTNKYKIQPKPLKIYKLISVFREVDINNLEEAFVVDPPQTTVFDSCFCELQYHNFQIYYRWCFRKDDTQWEDEWQRIY